MSLPSPQRIDFDPRLEAKCWEEKQSELKKKKKARLRNLSKLLTNSGGKVFFWTVILTCGSQSVLCAAVTRQAAMLFPATWGESRPSRIVSLLIPDSPRVVFVPRWPIYSSQGVKIPSSPTNLKNKQTKKPQHNKTKQQNAECALFTFFFFTKNGAHVSFPEERGRVAVGVPLHLPFFDKHAHTHPHASQPASRLPLPACLLPSLSLSFPAFRSLPLRFYTFPTLKCEMRGGSQDNWPCVSRVVWSRNAAEATHLRAAQQTVKCSTGGRTRLQRERGTRAV